MTGPELTGRRVRSVLVGVVAALVAASLPMLVPGDARAATRVPVRASDYGDHARVVFDWPLVNVPYDASVSGDKLLVIFGAPVDAALGPALERLGAWVSAAVVEGDGKTVAFTLKRPVKVSRDGRSGNSVYIDVVVDKSKPAVAAAPPPPPAPAPAQTPPQPAPPPPAAPKLAAAPAAPAAAAPPAPSPPPAPAPPPAKTAPQTPSATPAPTAPAPASTPAAAPAAAPAQGAASPVLAFDPGQPAAAAVYVRSDQLYLVFDRPLAIGAGTITGNGAGLVGVIQPVLAAGGSAFRVTMRPWLRPVVEREGTVWRVVFVPKVQPPRTELVVEAQPEFPLGGRVLVRAADASSVVEINDPDIGDHLLVVPLPAAVQAVSAINRFPEVEFQPALQGVVMRPHGDGVAARPVREGVEVTAAGGLHLSPVADAAMAHPSASANDAILNALGGEGGHEGERPPGAGTGNDFRLFDLAGWQREGGAETYTKNRQTLMQAVADATPKERNKTRLELARFYFAHGFNQEAMGVLDVLAADQPDVAGWPEFRALRGAARVAAGESREGLADLSGPGLDDNREAMLWRAYATANLRENWPRVAHDFYLADDILSGYPEPYFRRMSLAAIESRLQGNDPREAERLFKRLARKLGPESDKQPAMEFLRAEISRENGKVADALKHYQAAEDGGDRYYRARAGFARVNLEFQDKRIAAATAADRLSRLRFAWRGDELELDVIQRHGEMLWQAGEYAEGLNTLREAAGYFPESPRAAAITQSMSELFGELFKDGASKLPPLKAIELYDLFRELTPVGVAGDEVIRQLAERLVEVDLLGRASELLQHQVDYRLTGLDKAKVGTRLASIRLLDGKSDLALKAIESSEFAPLPPDIVEERRLLKARALADLRRSEEALKLLEGDTSKPADMLRVDIAWHDQRWDAAASALDKVIGPAPAAGKPVDKTTSQLVLNRAIALALAGDGAALNKLRTDFGGAMAKADEADAFAVLTRSEQGGGLVDLATIKSRVAEVDVFQNFLKEFHKRNPPPPS